MPSIGVLLAAPVLFGLGMCAAVWYGLLTGWPWAFVGGGGIAVLPAFEAGSHGGRYGWPIAYGTFGLFTVAIGLVVYFHFMGFG